MAIPYEDSTAGTKALHEMERLLAKFGCQCFGSMMDFENKELIVQFKYKNYPITLKASIAGYAALWLKEHPYSSRIKCSKVEHERKALTRAQTAVYSILRDWLKGQITAIECGIVSFEGAFLGQILLNNGKTVFQQVTESNLLALPDSSMTDGSY